MNRILILIAFLATPQLHADPYETAQRFTAGDVISAEVLNDILDRIELTLKDIERDEMIGTWEVTAYYCELGTADPTVDDVQQGPSATKHWGCLYSSSFNWDGVVSMEGSLYGKRVDTWTITAVSGSDSKFNIASTNYNFIYNRGMSGGEEGYVNDGNTHSCVMVAGQALMACELEFPDINLDGNHLAAYYNLQRLSSTRIKLGWAPRRGSGDFNIVIIDKTDIPPVAPTALSASVAGDVNAATVSLSWTINGSTATGGVVKRKLSLAGSWSTLGTPSTGSYSDTAITLNNSYWYRVFATNANGTSVGSNVVKVNWYNVPPSINIASTISIDENAFNATSNFTTLSVSDADAQTLTLTLGSQAPGNDASDFTLASDGGLSFNATPDYESPADYDTNNIYDLKLTATDGIETVSQDFSVVVLNVSD